jgi:hypothetical protein
VRELRTFEWAIEDVVTAFPGLYLEHAAAMAVAVLSQWSASPCEFLVECEGFCPPYLQEASRFLLRVGWSQQTLRHAVRVRRTEQAKPMVERAAVALAVLAFAHLLPNARLRVTEEGDRADFWLSPLRCALEVSGTEQVHGLERRHREKVVQMLGNSRRWSGYVFVCCFGPGQGRIRWSYHRQEGSPNV